MREWFKRTHLKCVEVNSFREFESLSFRQFFLGDFNGHVKPHLLDRFCLLGHHNNVWSYEFAPHSNRKECGDLLWLHSLAYRSNQVPVAQLVEQFLYTE